jgi:hypothetical protein
MWGFWQRPPCVLRTVIVNLKEGQSAIRGILWETRGPWFTVSEAQLLTAGSQPTPIDGTAVVHRENVAFLQVLP